MIELYPKANGFGFDNNDLACPQVHVVWTRGKTFPKQQSGVNSDPRQIINRFGGFLHHSVKKSLFMNYKINHFLFRMTLEKPLRCFMSSFAYI